MRYELECDCSNNLVKVLFLHYHARKPVLGGGPGVVVQLKRCLSPTVDLDIKVIDAKS